MSRHLTLFCAILSLGLTSVAAPAHAQDHSDALAKFFGAAATLIILGSVLEGSKSDVTVVPRSHHRRGPVVVQAAPRPIPKQCLRRVTGGKTRFAAMRKCLKRAGYKGLNRLPKACRLDIRTHNRLAAGYSMRCLRGRGYTAATN
jgi:hypothetical protein